jgi:hypothetical protein
VLYVGEIEDPEFNGQKILIIPKLYRFVFGKERINKYSTIENAETGNLNLWFVISFKRSIYRVKANHLGGGGRKPSSILQLIETG